VATNSKTLVHQPILRDSPPERDHFWCTSHIYLRHTADVDILRLQRGGEAEGDGQGEKCLRFSFLGLA
jgi:hypothetical protein